ncbi:MULTISPECIES: hypothetical protein [Legionella]|uniref:Uncharacterized protein n=1 Tax=Legionella steelei TaxID=947033 RepID=A0A0W0ZQB6_9GAMM|nr:MULTISPECIES: hypothetical protein [Legionella]KTD71436.1 hypothetical protein Lste_0202 [Legionella steelei]MBN9228961.1 hypothetical protein [Legionella steelei]OJW13178.1 MAG: hypothetical protein BGO44_07310 [Legionella sp. 39-23]
MKRFAVLIAGLALTGLAVADKPKEEVRHIVTLNGLKQGDGRYIRTDVVENGKYKFGYYFCGTRHSVVYGDIVFADEVSENYRVERSLKFSICQDETLTDCQEFASDQFTIFKNKDGYLETDSRPIVPLSIASVKDAYKACEPNPAENNRMKKIIHAGSDYLIRQG